MPPEIQASPVDRLFAPGREKLDFATLAPRPERTPVPTEPLSSHAANAFSVTALFATFQNMSGACA